MTRRSNLTDELMAAIYEEHDATDDLREMLTWPDVKASPPAAASITRSLNRLRGE